MNKNEVVIISGKGGTGKTTVTAALIPYINNPVIADCDVDAPDLYILLNPVNEDEIPFSGAKKAEIIKNSCTKCGACISHCRFNAITYTFSVVKNKCEGCGVCAFVCPADAVELKNQAIGNIFKASTSYGPMIHARLFPGEEASGKLVSEVRRLAAAEAESQGFKNIIVDGSPGTACNVISSLTNASRALIVTEPGISAFHDLERIFSVIKKFSIPASLIINKYDISREYTGKIRNFCSINAIPMEITIPYKKEILNAVQQKKPASILLPELFENLGFKALAKKIFT